MSGPGDGAGRQDDIVIIKQLLQKLEEAAQRDADAPRQVEPEAPSSAVVLVDPAAGGIQLPIPAAPRDTLMALKRGTSAAGLGESTAGQLVRTPIAIDLIPSQTAVATSEPPSRSRPGRGLAIAGLSFAMGIVAAGGLILAFDPFRTFGSIAARQPAPVVPSVAQAPAAGEPQRITVSDPAPQIGAEQGSAAAPTVTASATPAEPPDAGSSRSSSAGTSGAPPSSSNEPAREIASNGSEVSTSAPAVVAEKPRLQLPTEVEVRAGDRQPLDLALEVPEGEQQKLLVVFRQMPAWLTLSKGGAIGNGIWLLPAPQAREVDIVGAEAARGKSDVKVQLAHIDGSILAETTLSVQAVAAPPATAPVPMASAPSGEATILRLQARGEFLLDTGEIEAARTLLRTAAEAGSVAAALRLAETYDPGEMQRLGMAERTADVVQAARWYEHAQALGSPVAAARLTALGRR